eukprot:s394_g12.t1
MVVCVRVASIASQQPVLAHVPAQDGVGVLLPGNEEGDLMSRVCVTGSSEVFGLSGECGLLPKMPEGPFVANSNQVGTGECGLLPRMPSSSHRSQGECGLLPKMPGGPFVANNSDLVPGECGLLPKMPVGPFVAKDQDLVPGECGLLPTMPVGPLVASETASSSNHHHGKDDSFASSAHHMEGLPPTVLDVDHATAPFSEVPFAAAITPTATWTQPPVALVPSTAAFSVGECSVPQRLLPDAPPSVSATPLLGLKGAQFFKLSIPAVDNEQHLWALRHQFFTTDDRKAVLHRQNDVWADDEIRMHLHALSKQYIDVQVQSGSSKVQRVLVVDPLVSSSWGVRGGGSMYNWTDAHPEVFREQVQVVTAVLVDHHWIPVLMQPNGDVLNFLMWDSTTQHAALENALSRIALGLGFARSLVNCHKRMFFNSELCGALAIAFIQHSLLGTMLPTTNEDAQNFHMKYRDLFVQSLSQAELTSRPWVWGVGDRLVRVGLPLQFLPLFPLVLGMMEGWHTDVSLLKTASTCSLTTDWHGLTMKSGRHLCASWCRENPQVRSAGHHIVSAIVHEAHWTPIWIVPHGRTLVMHLMGDDQRCEFRALTLLFALVAFLGFDDWSLHWTSPPVRGHQLCGALAIAFLGQVIVGARLPTTVRQLADLNTELRATYVAALYNGYVCRCPCVWGFGPTNNVLKDLAAELGKHGVPADQVDARAQQALRALGSEQIMTALRHRQPWRQLKILGNNARFQFLLPSEFTAMVDNNKGKAVGKKPRNVRVDIPGKNTDIDPSKLVLLIALISAQEAAPYLKAGQQVSQEPLALLVVHKPDHAVETQLPSLQVTVPCKCVINQEPLLIDATLVQLGGTPVEKHSHVTAVAVDSLEVATVKFLAYADEFPGDWTDFLAAPIKAIVGVFPKLKRCFASNCQCEAWHNPDGLPVKEPILDVWRRQHLKSSFKPAAAKDSDIFSVCIRVPLSLIAELLASSGRSVVFSEPRTPDGRDLLDTYVVIWTPKLSVAELLHMKQTHPAVVGLARLGDRRGLRVLTDQAHAMHQILKPDTVFLPHGPRLQFAAGPFPWGTDRGAIQRAMKQIKWDTKPLQPLSPVPGRGTMWLLQAVDEPPETIVPMAHGEVLISKHREPNHAGKPGPTHAVGAANTISLCEAAPPAKGGEDDPFQTAKHDPWRHYQSSTKPAVPVVASHSESIQQLETRIQSAVLAKVQSGMPMDQDDLPDRLQALEGQVQQLVAKQNNIDTQFREFSGQHTQQLHTMQAQLNQQSTQVHGHLESHTQAMQALFESQMQQIRGLLSKRPRDEGAME